jgi:hypothetical protein
MVTTFDVWAEGDGSFSVVLALQAFDDAVATLQALKAKGRSAMIAPTQYTPCHAPEGQARLSEVELSERAAHVGGSAVVRLENRDTLCYAVFGVPTQDGREPGMEFLYLDWIDGYMWSGNDVSWFWSINSGKYSLPPERFR